MRDAGYRILLDPAIQCTHRKRVTLGGMIASDFSRRGVPWTHLLLDIKKTPRGLSLGVAERVSAVVVVIFVILLAVMLIQRSGFAAIVAISWLFVFVGANQQLFAKLSRLRGKAFLMAAIPLHLIYNFVAVCALIWGAITHPFIRTARERYTPRR